MKIGKAEKIRQKYAGQFDFEDVTQIEQMEQELLHLSKFTSEDAIALGLRILALSKAYEEDMFIQIERVPDHLTIFQYAGEQIKQRNLEFAVMKYNTVATTGHCSLWALAKGCNGEALSAVFDAHSQCFPTGGAFPIYVKGQVIAIVTSSGLHHGGDHKVIVQALSDFQDKAIPAYSGLIV